ncbi:hypothetical protein CDAR_501831 [Caerostris darwini]|uniref:Uncharacterized protein n=1 Tax=Caerostris darwini TaxID=1538125 RepID=A0AAV4TL60_9ARAC|nr:hypothetical protein CDAR_501831 [Caerostris darwini]
MKAHSLNPDMGGEFKLIMSKPGLYVIQMQSGNPFAWIQEGRLWRQTQMQPLSRSRLFESEAPLRKCVAINHHLDICRRTSVCHNGDFPDLDVLEDNEVRCWGMQLRKGGRGREGRQRFRS